RWAPAQEREQLGVESDAGGHVGATGAVEVDLDEHLRLLGGPLDACGPAHCCTSVSAFSKAAISSGGPLETPSEPSGPVSRTSTPRSSRPCQTACRSANVPK